VLVKTIAIRAPAPGNQVATEVPLPRPRSPVEAGSAGAVPAVDSTPSPARRVRRAMLRPDICARHGLRKVDVIRGRWKGWRCRR
jgi:hypothetical protein